MIRSSWKSLLIGAVVAVTLLSATHQADAQWWGVYRPAACGWGCGYASCYTPCCGSIGCGSCYGDSGWYLGWRPGPIRRLLFGPYRSYWGGYCGGCYSSCCGGCYSTGCATCGEVPTAATATFTPNKPTLAPTPAQKPVMPPPVMPTEPSPAALAPTEPAPPKTTSTDADHSGVLTVWVPYDAKVTVNGLETRSVGSKRQFVSFGLKPGLSYKYVVRATIIRDGQLVEDTQTVALTAGQITAVAFGFNAETGPQVAMVH